MSQQLFTVSHSAVGKPGLATAKSFQTQTGAKPAVANFAAQQKASFAAPAQVRMSLGGTPKAGAVSMSALSGQVTSFSNPLKAESKPMGSAS